MAAADRRRELSPTVWIADALDKMTDESHCLLCVQKHLGAFVKHVFLQ